MEKPEAEMTTDELWEKYEDLVAKAASVLDSDSAAFNEFRRQADAIGAMIVDRGKGLPKD
jgi:hypothetical protein